MKYSVSLAGLLFASNVLFGQTIEANYYPYYDSEVPEEEEVVVMGEGLTDEITVGTAFMDDRERGLYYRLTRFHFGAVRYDRRGYDPSFSAYALNGYRRYNYITGRPDYTLLSLLQTASVPSFSTNDQNRPYPVAVPSDELSFYVISAESFRMGKRVALQTTNRRYRMALKASVMDYLMKKGYYAVSVYRRWGRDPYIDGVFSDETGYMAAFTCWFKSSLKLSLFTAGAPATRGLRSAATREAFELTGNNLYNPVWGWQEGRMRNSRVRTSFQPVVALTLTNWFSGLKYLSFEALYHWGRNSQSGLGWYEAGNALPDYYRKMPSYLGNEASEVAEAWRRGDPRYTQVNWQELYWANRAGEHAAYLLEDRVEQLSNIYFRALCGTQAGLDWSWTCWVGFRRDHSRFFKEADDLLGASHVLNVDQYLIDDLYFGERIDNDLRNPLRRVGTGDRFGYDYALRCTILDGQAIVRYHLDKFDAAISAGVARVGFLRTGFYEKALFPGSGSWGDSRPVNLTLYSAMLTSSLILPLRNRLSLRLMARSDAPAAENLFAAVSYNNALVRDPQAERIAGAELGYSYGGMLFSFALTAYYTASSGGCDVRHYYDDLSSTYSNLVVRRIAKRWWGVEAAASISILSSIPSLDLDLTAAWTPHRYASDPTADLYADADHSLTASGISCRLEGFRTSCSPEVTTAAELTFRHKRWTLSLSFDYAAERYVEASPSIHSSRTEMLGSSPEIRTLFSSQERLPDAAVVGFSVGKGFVVGSSYLQLTFSVDNLLNDKNIVYSAYEPMRLLRSGSGILTSFRPFDTRYMYSYPLTFFASLSFRF